MAVNVFTNILDFPYDFMSRSHTVIILVHKSCVCGYALSKYLVSCYGGCYRGYCDACINLLLV